MNRAIRPVLATLLLGCVLAAAVRADIINVPGDYPTIQEAVDAAVTGDEVRIAPGTYYEGDIQVSAKDIAIVGEGGAAVTIVDADLQGSGFCLEGPMTSAARIEGLTIQHAGGLSGNCPGSAGIYCHSGASPSILGCVVTNCWGNGTGGGIVMNAASETSIEDCVVHQNSSGSENETSGYAGGMELAGPISVRRCQITENSVAPGQFGPTPSGGGVGCSGGVYFEDCLIAGNTVAAHSQTGTGGGVVGAGAFTRCRIEGNSAPGLGGGLDLTGPSELRECVVAGNMSGSGGAGIAVSDGASVEMIACTISSNHADGTGGAPVPGGGVHVAGSSVLSLGTSILWGNCSAIDWNEAYVEAGSSLTFECADVDIDEVGGPGEVGLTGVNIFTDPWFCGPIPCDQAPGADGDYTLAADSPCLPENNPCGERIGAEGAGCDPVAVREATIGRLKTAYR